MLLGEEGYDPLGAEGPCGCRGFEELPTDFETLPLPQTTSVCASDGTALLARFYDEIRLDVPITEVAVVMRRAMVAAEDMRSTSTNGVDLTPSPARSTGAAAPPPATPFEHQGGMNRVVQRALLTRWPDDRRSDP